MLMYMVCVLLVLMFRSVFFTKLCSLSVFSGRAFGWTTARLGRQQNAGSKSWFQRVHWIPQARSSVCVVHNAVDRKKKEHRRDDAALSHA